MMSCKQTGQPEHITSSVTSAPRVQRVLNVPRIMALPVHGVGYCPVAYATVVHSSGKAGYQTAVLPANVYHQFPVPTPNRYSAAMGTAELKTHSVSSMYAAVVTSKAAFISAKK